MTKDINEMRRYAENLEKVFKVRKGLSAQAPSTPVGLRLLIIIIFIY